MSSHFIHLKLLFKKLGIALFIYTLCRVLFYAFNSYHFHGVSFGMFFYGIRFDIVSISFLFSPLILLHLLPFSFKNLPWYERLLSIAFYTSNTLSIALNLIDVAYFDFTLKRTTTDFFGMIGTGNDFIKLLPRYIIDFWYDYLLLIGLLFLSRWLYRKFGKLTYKFYPFALKDYLIHSTIFIVGCILTVFGMRGGFQYKPIDIINGGQYAQAQNVPIVLNTPFTIIKTVLVDNIESVNYFTDEEVETIFTPVKQYTDSSILQNKNVVIIILESFAKEYVGGFNDGIGYTPFIDSLMKESYVFNNAYANGQKSIEALPCIFSGLPQLMSSSYVLSNYASNELDALPKVLKEHGYNTSFYHGGENGTMGFNGFTGLVGIDNYYGLNEYPNKEKDFDGSWGIFDEPYLQYFANELTDKKEPFFSVLFTVSSHHPYKIPPQYKGKFPKGNLPLHETVGYTDYALKQFFKSTQKLPWFKNTIFIFTADHSTHSNGAFYQTRLGRFAIPAFIFAPSTSLKGISDEYFQHIDITPTIIDALGYENSIVTFGNSAFDTNETKFNVNYVNNSYQIAINDYFLIFDGENTLEFYDIKNDSLLSNNLINNITNKQLAVKNKAEKQLKAIIQQYNNRLINNDLSIKK